MSEISLSTASACFETLSGAVLLLSARLHVGDLLLQLLGRSNRGLYCRLQSTGAHTHVVERSVVGIAHLHERIGADVDRDFLDGRRA